MINANSKTEAGGAGILISDKFIFIRIEST